MQIRRPEALERTWLSKDYGDGDGYEHCALGYLMVELTDVAPKELSYSEQGLGVPISYYLESRIAVEDLLGVTRGDTNDLIKDNDNATESEMRVDRLGEWLQQHGHSYMEEADAI